MKSRKSSALKERKKLNFESMKKDRRKCLTARSLGRFYEKRRCFEGALDQFGKALNENNEETSIFVDRSRVFLKMANLFKARQDSGFSLRFSSRKCSFFFCSFEDAAFKLIESQKIDSPIVFYEVFLQKAQVFFVEGEFEFGKRKIEFSLFSLGPKCFSPSSFDVFPSSKSN